MPQPTPQEMNNELLAGKDALLKMQTQIGVPQSGASTLGVGGGAKAPTGQEYGPQGQLQPMKPNTGSPQKTTAQIQAEADALHAQPLPSDTTTRTSSQIDSNFQALLDKIGSKPVAPDTNAIETAQDAKSGGVNDLQGQLETLNQQRMDMENSIEQEKAGEASKPGVVSTIINGRMRMVSAEHANALNTLKSSISATTTKLRNAQTAVATFMRNTKTDYNTASSNYEKEYASAIKYYDDAVSQQDKAQVNAKANAQVIINSYKGSSAGINSITPEQEAQWAGLELQAGLPAGTMKAAVQAELNITKFTKGSDGNMYISGTDNNGIPYVAKVGAAGGTTAQANVNVPSKKSPTQTPEQKTVAAFNKAIAVPPKTTETREQYARRLQAQFPNINPDDILRKVYEVYPDSYKSK